MSVPAPALHAATVRTLLPAEFTRLLGLDGPLADLPAIPDPDHVRAIVAEDEAGQIIAYWLLFEAVHAEPLWIAPDHRGRTHLAQALMDQVTAELKAAGVTGVFAIIEDEQVQHLAEHAGFKRMPGVLYGRHIQPQEEPT